MKIDEKIEKYLDEGFFSKFTLKVEKGWVNAYKGKKIVAKAKSPVEPGDKIDFIDKGLTPKEKEKVLELISNS